MFVNKYSDLSLREWQNKVLPPPYEPIILEGESIHSNKNPNLLTDELDFKEFNHYYNPDITVSNIGRVKYKGEFADQIYDNIQGVLYINTNNTKHPREDVHRLVALPWLNNNKGDDYRAIHHINNNGYNNSIKNLLVVTPAQHEMIHIKGIWRHGDFFIEFYENKFIIYKYDNIILYSGIFSFIDINVNRSPNTSLELTLDNQKINLSHQNQNVRGKKNKILNNFQDKELNGCWERFKYNLNVLK
jgi:hypothetical protein